MGSSLSIIDNPVETAKVSESKKEEAEVVSAPEHVAETITESKPVTDTKTPPTTPVLEASQKVVEVFERYIEPKGTTIEVLPVDVAPSDDIITKIK